ncbi:Rap1a/Tai family immunity protein [Pseudomonas fluorescens]|uniref:Rap1a immunity protein domain-containing protein n=1 Tax=Pseudomonas fluorescens TaxID=294 RepID=A0A5E7RIA0_PSEFL|nr:Rap1a/Tai family immunity protein [Pseudomonas fluorescens]VVP73515.1 hypothetical protein PS922_01082 [Pseudomonas fluorescens]
MKAWIGAVALAGMLGSGAAMAKGGDGNELLAQCQQYIKYMDSENFNNYAADTCSGFLQGVVSTVIFYSEILKKDEKFCLPNNVTNSQVVRVVVKYLKDNPKLLNEGRTGLAWYALKDAYPCK